MLGVFYPKKQAVPVLVMELMEYNLTQLLKRSHNIPMYVKLSILQDVSRGLCYLHDQNPPIVHQALYSDNILFTKGLIAKISDFKTGAETVSDQVVLSIRRNRASNSFLPDSRNILKYDVSLNVFSFGCIVCHVITQTFPSIQHQPLPILQDQPLLPPPSKKKRGGFSFFTGAQYIFGTASATTTAIIGSASATTAAIFFPTEANTRDTSATPVRSHMVHEWYIEQRRDYIDAINNDSLKKLVEACLQHNSINRPQILQVYKRICSIMKGEYRVAGIYHN